MPNGGFLLIMIASFFMTFDCRAQIVVRVAGDGTGIPGYSGDGDLARNASLSYPSGLAQDKKGDIYIADYSNHVIRRIDKHGIISTFAGSGEEGYEGDGGPATAASMHFPKCIFFDKQGNLLYSDFQKIRKIDTNGIITTFAGTGDIGLKGDNGPATAAWFKNPGGIAEDKYGNIYITDGHNDRIRRVDANGTITTYAGTYIGYSGDGGAATNARLDKPNGLAFDKAGNLYVSDSRNNVIRRIDTNGIITTVAGSGLGAGTINGGLWGGDGFPAKYAWMNYPGAIRFDDTGALYICDGLNNAIRMVDTSGIMHTIAGIRQKGNSPEATDARVAKMDGPSSILVTQKGRVLFADVGNHAVKEIASKQAPAFINGDRIALDLCIDSGKSTLNDLLSVRDPDELQGLVWHIIDAPKHGGVVGDGYESVGPGSIDAAGCSMSYIPLRTYSGSDSFSVSVFDGYKADTMHLTVYVGQAENLSCGPIPSQGTINLTGAFGCDTRWLHLQVINLSGQTVLVKDVAAENGILREQLELSRNLPRGIYLMRVSGGSQNRVFHLELN